MNLNFFVELCIASNVAIFCIPVSYFCNNVPCDQESRTSSMNSGSASPTDDIHSSPIHSGPDVILGSPFNDSINSSGRSVFSRSPPPYVEQDPPPEYSTICTWLSHSFNEWERRKVLNCLFYLCTFIIRRMNGLSPSLLWFYEVPLFRLIFITSVLPLTFCQQL